MKNPAFSRVGQIWKFRELNSYDAVLIVDSRKLATEAWRHQVLYLETSQNYRLPGEVHTWTEYLKKPWEYSFDMSRVI
jgi:hypothetical protein